MWMWNIEYGNDSFTPNGQWQMRYWQTETETYAIKILIKILIYAYFFKSRQFPDSY